MNKKNPKKALNPNWGGYREKSGRKSTWNHKETSTIRIPKALEQEVMRYARYLDAGLELDNETDSSQGDDFVTESNLTVVERINDEFEDEINSSLETINALNTTDQLERVTESGFEGYPRRSFMDAIFLAREIVQQKKSARISLAKFISRFYLTPVNSESLRSYP
ncbi:hypothetical protein [Nodularia sp. NIES-3585]|uniref:hypothetical protein n=1 Tax=Nodularia sp. NIES-3585 TaxID=1973477 RepID=UPI000B5CE456|nr:hypothetical protein [Nodularia sp. NIES-3585]GAX36219.1 hypothetical protein NIES3585_22450 [Nodularia sp. NIES-3585]GAX37195.1 hypothetical protein NIES3585_32370 [Nodularia sp. NIES-3585]